MRDRLSHNNLDPRKKQQEFPTRSKFTAPHCFVLGPGMTTEVLKTTNVRDMLCVGNYHSSHMREIRGRARMVELVMI